MAKKRKRHRKPPPNRCANCGVPISPTAEHCFACRGEARAFDIPDPDEFRRRCEEVQATWSEVERIMRAGYTRAAAEAIARGESVEMPRLRRLSRRMKFERSDDAA